MGAIFGAPSGDGRPSGRRGVTVWGGGVREVLPQPVLTASATSPPFGHPLRPLPLYCLRGSRTPQQGTRGALHVSWCRGPTDGRQQRWILYVHFRPSVHSGCRCTSCKCAPCLYCARHSLWFTQPCVSPTWPSQIPALPLLACALTNLCKIRKKKSHRGNLCTALGSGPGTCSGGRPTRPDRRRLRHRKRVWDVSTRPHGTTQPMVCGATGGGLRSHGGGLPPPSASSRRLCACGTAGAAALMWGGGGGSAAATAGHMAVRTGSDGGGGPGRCCGLGPPQGRGLGDREAEQLGPGREGLYRAPQAKGYRGLGDVTWPPPKRGWP